MQRQRVSSQYFGATLAGRSEGASRPTAGSETREFTSRVERGRVPPLFKQLRQRIIVGLLLMFGLLAGIAEVRALKNACGKCGKQAELADLICKACANPLNLCLACGTQNPVSNDYCSRCGEMLAEMRVLATIDPEIREELRLGQSDRAQLERELAKIDNQLVKEPGKAEALLYRQAKIFKRMNFFAKEAKAWQDYLEKFPGTARKNRVKAFESEALRQWGYLFYEQSEMPKALAKFEEAVKANPVNAEAWQWIGRLKNETKDPKGAADAYLASLKAKPGDKTAIHFLRLLKVPIPKDLLKPVAPAIQIQEAPTEKPGESASKPVSLPVTPVVGSAAPVAATASTSASVSASTSASASASTSTSTSASASTSASVTASAAPMIIPGSGPAAAPALAPSTTPASLTPSNPTTASPSSSPLPTGDVGSEPQKVLIPADALEFPETVPSDSDPGNASDANNPSEVPSQAE